MSYYMGFACNQRGGDVVMMISERLGLGEKRFKELTFSERLGLGAFGAILNPKP